MRLVFAFCAALALGSSVHAQEVYYPAVTVTREVLRGPLGEIKVVRIISKYPQSEVRTIVIDRELPPKIKGCRSRLNDGRGLMAGAQVVMYRTNALLGNRTPVVQWCRSEATADEWFEKHVAPLLDSDVDEKLAAYDGRIRQLEENISALDAYVSQAARDAALGVSGDDALYSAIKTKILMDLAAELDLEKAQK